MTDTLYVMRMDLRHKLSEAERFEKAGRVDLADMALRHACRVEAEINDVKCWYCNGTGYAGPLGDTCGRCDGSGYRID